MFRKLMKYEMKDYARTMLPLYLALLAIAAMGGVMFNPNSDVLPTISVSLMVTIITGTGLTWFFISILRFRNNLFGDEAYNALSLPVAISTHVIVKLLTALLWGCMTFLMTILAVYTTTIISGSLSFGEILKDFRLSIMVNYHNNYLLFARDALLIIGTVITSVSSSLTRIYASIAIGHQFDEHPMLMSIVAYLVIGMINSILTTILGVMTNFLTYFAMAFNTSITSLWMIIAISAGYTLIYILITVLIMKYRPTLS